MTKPVEVVFIAGIGRSGSTLLSRLLGSIEGVENLGEFASYWTNLDLNRRGIPCGCGTAVAQCPRWADWLEDGFIGGWSGRAASNGSVFVSGASVDHARRRVGAELGKRYQMVARESGARLLTDASKRPALALALAASPDVSMHMVHLVRDPRSVAASRLRPKDYLRRQPTWETGLRWTGVNLAVERVRKSVASSALIRFEDLTANPLLTVKTLLDSFGLEGFDSSRLGQSEIDVDIQHSLAGNPDKLAGNSLTVRADRGGARLQRADDLWTGVTTFLLRGRYRY